MSHHPIIPNQDSLKFLLHRLGLSLREIVVYEFLFHYGPQTSSVVANKIKMNRTTVYHVLQRLAQRDLCVSYRRSNALFFDLSPLESTVGFLEKQRESIKLQKQILGQIAELRGGRR